MKTGTAEPGALIVLGMHRSGTSALAGTFSMLGFSLGDDLLPAVADDNPKGYFEHNQVVAVHDRLFASFGMDWQDLRALPQGWLQRPATRQARSELREILTALMADGETAVIKDPRLCRFVPLWRELFAEMGVNAHFAFIARHPVEVAASLRRRGSMSDYRAGLLSMAYQMEAEQATRDASRVFLTYEDLIADWRTQIARCHAAFGMGPVPADPVSTAAVDGFLDAQLRNHRATEEFALDPDAVAVYHCIQSAAHGEADELPAVFDEIRPRFEASRRGYEAALDTALSAIDLDRQRHVPAWSEGLGLANAWNAPPMAALPASASRLYLRSNDGSYSEDGMLAAHATMAADGIAHAAFVVEPALPMDRLRFDPESQAGAYAVVELRIGGQTVTDLPARVKVMHEHRLAPSVGDQVAWASDDDDPWMELDLAGLEHLRTTGHPVEVELRFRRLTAFAVAEEAAAMRHSRQLERMDVLQKTVEDRAAGFMQGQASLADYAQQAHARQIDFMQQAHAAQVELVRQTLASHMARHDALASQLGVLSGVLMELKQRSDRPVLYRLGRQWRARKLRSAQRAAGWKVLVEPTANVALSSNGRWRSSQRDPQFSLRMAGPQMSEALVPPGWYVLTIDGRVYEGRLANPCLYPCHGCGTQDSERVGLLPYDAAGRSETVVYLAAGLRSLRLDPSDEDACFDMDVRLRPVTRPAAWVHMMRGVHRARGGGLANGTRLSWSMLVTGLTAGLGAVRQQCLIDYRALQSRLSSDYARWIGRNEPVSSPADVAARLAALPRRPLLSVVMPVYEAPERWLRRALDSVIEQHYPDWELCVSDDASPSPHVRRVLEEYQRRDRRIKVVYRQKNGHISESSNSALEVATGEYMVLLDHDDELHAEALLLVAEAACSAPDAKLIYSDEDKIDEDGRRFDPYFKADWNYDLFLGQNCISHLGVYSLPLVRELGGFRKGLEGSQDWDLALRCVERIAPGQIVHIPRVLYHWRAIQGSTALAAGEKNYAVVAGRRAVEEHLQRTGQAGEVSILPASMMRVKRPVPVPAPKVSLVIPTRDRVDLLRMCVDSILERSTYPDFEILVVDNGSVEPGTLEYFARISGLANVRVLSYPGEFNYSAINNFAVAQARGEVIGLVNNDIEVISADWMEEMVAHAMRPDVGAVGAMLYYPDDTIQHAGVLVGLCGVAGHVGSRHPRGSQGYFGRMLLAQELSAVTAACLLVRRSVYEEVGGLDERLRVAFNDVDLCLRIREKGYRNLWTPFAELYHHESASRGLEDNPVKQARFMSEVAFMQERWGEALQRDPAYNPNLSLTQPFVLES